MESTKVIADEDKHITFRIPDVIGPGLQLFVHKISTDRECSSGDCGSEKPPVKTTSTCVGDIPVREKMTNKPTSSEPTPSDFGFPKGLNETVRFKGPFDGRPDNTEVEIGNEKATVLAESPHSLVVKNPSTKPGPNTIRLKEGGVELTGVSQNFAGGPTQAPVSEVCTQEVDRYKSQLRLQTNTNWSPPKPPSHGTWDVSLSYHITPDLRIENLQTTQPSGYQPLDDSARSQVMLLQGNIPQIPSCAATTGIDIVHKFKLIYR